MAKEERDMLEESAYVSMQTVGKLSKLITSVLEDCRVNLRSELSARLSAASTAWHLVNSNG